MAATRPPQADEALRRLAAAGVAEDPAYYGRFTADHERAVLTVPQLIQAAWAANDADLFAATFAANGSLLMRDDQLTSRDEIHAYMSAGFRGQFRGARVTGWPEEVLFLRPGVALVVTRGGIVLPGERTVAPERAIRATWVIVAQDGQWRLLSHHGSPLHSNSQNDMTGTTMTSDAARLVAQAKEWAGHYGDFSNGPEGAVLTVPLRVKGAWDRNDADALAEVFTDEGSMLDGDDQLTDPEQIRAYMTDAFAGRYRGTRLSTEPVEIRVLADDVALAITKGGIIRAGETEPAADRQVRGTWVAARRDGEWRLVSYQTSPISG